MKIKVSKNIIKRITSFVASDIWKNQNPNSKTQYWEYHSNLLNKFEISGEHIEINGIGGFDIPNEKYSFNAMTRPLKNLIKNVFYKQKSRHLSFEDAFQKIVNENKIGKDKGVKFDKKKIFASNYSEIKEIYPFNYNVYHPNIILSYYYINILNSYIDFSKAKYVAEIGSGSGNLISLLKHHNKIKCMIDIDLPEMLLVCIVFLTKVFPEAKVLFPHEIDNKVTKNTLLNYDFIFLAPSQIHLLEDNLFDLFINTISFQEMQKNQIKQYFDLVQRAGKKDSYFFIQNRLEKKPIDEHGNIDPNDPEKVKSLRFFEYPFFDNEIIIFEECRFSSLVKKAKIYTRLEKILKN